MLCLFLDVECYIDVRTWLFQFIFIEVRNKKKIFVQTNKIDQEIRENSFGPEKISMQSFKTPRIFSQRSFYHLTNIIANMFTESYYWLPIVTLVSQILAPCPKNFLVLQYVSNWKLPNLPIQ